MQSIQDKIRNLPASIFLSGVEGNTYWDIVVKKGGCKNVLTSYHYFQKQPAGTLKRRLAETPGVNVFIDSGAFTFFDKPKYELRVYEEYIEHYVEWLRDNKEYIFAAAAMDLENIVGQDVVLEWNRKYFEPLKEEGILICYVWHSSTGDKTWADYCKKYDYVGLGSDADISLQKYMQLVNVAKKHNTIVHGMAFTKTALLVRLPLATVDSTTWIVGQQYGEFNHWDGRKMSRLKKLDWRRKLKTKLIKPPFNADWELLTKGMGGQGDTYELLRLNVVSFMDAQEHIRKRLGPQQYWLKGETKKEKGQKDMLSALPTLEWLEGDMADWKEVAKKMNITIDAPKDEICAIIADFRRFILQEESLLNVDDEDALMENCELLTRMTAEDGEDALEKLKAYYLSNLTGERGDFADEVEQASNRPQERTDYIIEEDDYDVVELNEQEVGLYLPAPANEMPEIDAYDTALQKQNIQVVRGEGGRFVKGQQLVRKPRNIYSEKFPKLACNTCYKSGDCPDHRANAVCAYDKLFKRFDVRNHEEVMETMTGMINHNLQRMQKAMAFETMDGGMPTAEVTSLIDQNMRYLEKLQQLRNPAKQPLFTQNRVIHNDGTEQVSTQVNGNPAQGGILSQILSRALKQDTPDHTEVDPDHKDAYEVVDVEYTPVPEEETPVPKPPKKKLIKKAR